MINDADDHDIEAVEQPGLGKASQNNPDIDPDFDVLSGRQN